jgi:transcriptional regulator with XRE-family HTH domain
MAMNPLERMRDDIRRIHSDAELELTAPIRETGIWTLEINFGTVQLSVDWSDRSGFGVSMFRPENFGEGADEVYSSYQKALNRISQLLAGDERTTPPFAVLLARLREERGLTQQDVATKLGVKQSTISGMERRDDIQLSTLQKLIGALGGAVEVFIRFSDANYRLSLTASPKRNLACDLIATEPKRRSVGSRQRSSSSFSSSSFRQLSKAGNLKGAEEKAQRIRVSQSVLEMY